MFGLYRSGDGKRVRCAELAPDRVKDVEEDKTRTPLVLNCC